MTQSTRKSKENYIEFTPLIQPSLLPLVIYTPMSNLLGPYSKVPKTGMVYQEGPLFSSTAPPFPIKDLVPPSPVTNLESHHTPSILLNRHHDHSPSELPPSNEPPISLNSILPAWDSDIDYCGKIIPKNLPSDQIAKTIAPTGEAFFFDYGVVVLWGMTEMEEAKVLEEIASFQDDKLS